MLGSMTNIFDRVDLPSYIRDAESLQLYLGSQNLNGVDLLQELLLKLVEDYYPLPTDPDASPESALKGLKAKKSGGDAGRQVLTALRMCPVIRRCHVCLCCK